MQVRRLGLEACARFCQRQSELLCRFSQEAHQALEDQPEILATEVTTEVWRRTDLSLQTIHAEVLTQQPNQEHAG